MRGGTLTQRPAVREQSRASIDLARILLRTSESSLHRRVEACDEVAHPVPLVSRWGDYFHSSLKSAIQVPIFVLFTQSYLLRIQASLLLSHLILAMLRRG